MRKVIYIAVFFSLLLALYAFLFSDSLRRIDKFCESINSETKVIDLKKLAEKAGVDLRGPREMHEESGNYIYAIAASSYTVGEYACSIHASSLDGFVIKKRLGY